MASYHQGVFGPPSDKLLKVNLNGFRALQVTRLLGRKFCANPFQMRDGLWHFDLYGTPYEQYCPAIPQCNPADKYRTIDGSCNNLEHPIWGRSVSQFSRILPPSYSDGISEFRLSVSGRPLPLARFVSTQLTFTSSQLDPVVNVMFMQWGQLLDHDMTLGSSTRAFDGTGLLCCNQTHPESASMHPACREHNRLSRELKRINPHWNDETIFQEARRIVGAGRSAMKLNDLMLKNQGYSYSYDPNINPAIMNEFAASAYRWHSFVQMKNFLFPAGNATFGLDLAAIDIQRERDHGTPPYNEFRKVCGLPKIRNFQDLNGVLQPGMAEKFSQIYEHVDDIELFVAGHSEIPLPEGLVGPTFACIATEQFRRLKNGDRFWFENGGMPNSFSEQQLNELRKVTLSGVLCANGDQIQQIQPFAMIIKSRLNQNIDCRNIPQINLKFWQE
ncbi:PREDICTED: peroxidasin-like [Rhagoletis zephyria]|uniref:peroxidasin-like n=1 Tax=Rhagoletis zephyria TaxID=28612 RepID=UPI00081159DB|nr:PREDICTED: peroxidasin-like [Rhagoletis zephyria]